MESDQLYRGKCWLWEDVIQKVSLTLLCLCLLYSLSTFTTSDTPSVLLYLRTFDLPPISIFATNTLTNNHGPEWLHKLFNSRKSITSRPERRKIFVTRERIKSITCGGMVISAVTRLHGMFFRLTLNPASGWYSLGRRRLEVAGIGLEPTLGEGPGIVPWRLPWGYRWSLTLFPSGIKAHPQLVRGLFVALGISTRFSLERLRKPATDTFDQLPLLRPDAASSTSAGV